MGQNTCDTTTGVLGNDMLWKDLASRDGIEVLGVRAIYTCVKALLGWTLKLEKWPWQTMCINEGLCNTVFRILLIFYKCSISISRSEEHLSWMMWSFLTTGHLIQLPGVQ